LFASPIHAAASAHVILLDVFTIIVHDCSLFNGAFSLTYTVQRQIKG
jgi:hypothetical protein